MGRALVLFSSVAALGLASSPAAADDCDFAGSVKKDDVAAVQALLRRGCNPSALDADGLSPLYHAAMNSQKRMTLALLDGGADPNVAGLLARLSQDTDTSFVELFVGHGARVNAQDPDGKSALHAVAEASESTGAPGCDPDSGRSEEARCWRGYGQMARFLLAHGANPNLQDKFGRTPVHAAIGNDLPDVAWILLHAKGANLSLADNSGWTPLHLAARKGETRLVRFLLSRRANPNQPDESGATALHETSDLPVARLLIAKGAKLAAQDDAGDTPLHRAAAWGERCEAQPSSSLGRLLVFAGAPIDTRNSRGRTPLHSAAVVGNAELVKLLLERGAKATVKDDNGLTPLHLLGLLAEPCVPLRESWRQTVSFLVKAGARFDDVDAAGRTPLWLALTEEKSGVMDLFLSSGAKATDLGPRGASLLHLEAYLNHHGAVDRLLESGAGLEARDVDGRTPLLWAAAHGNTNAVTRLLAKGAEPSTADSTGRTSLDWAQTACHEPTIQALLKAGARQGSGRPPPCPRPGAWAVDERLEGTVRQTQTKDLKALVRSGIPTQARDHHGRTALHLVASYSFLADEFRLLLDQKADPNAKDDEGATPLHLVAADAREEFARILIASGADVNAADTRGRAPLHLVPFRNSVYELTTLLIENGANLGARDRLGRTPLHAVCGATPESRPRAELLVCRGANPDAKDLLGWSASDLAAIAGWTDASPVKCGKAWENYQRQNAEDPARPRLGY